VPQTSGSRGGDLGRGRGGGNKSKENSDIVKCQHSSCRTCSNRINKLSFNSPSWPLCSITVMPSQIFMPPSRESIPPGLQSMSLYCTTLTPHVACTVQDIQPGIVTMCLSYVRLPPKTSKDQRFILDADVKAVVVKCFQHDSRMPASTTTRIICNSLHSFNLILLNYMGI
jgi:hypothetical protein